MSVEDGLRLLPWHNDDHGGVIVEMPGETMERDVFVQMLRRTMSLLKQQGKKGVWIKLPIAVVNLVEPAVKEGFWYHHAEPNYLMLVRWIPQTASTLPANASHRVGIGAIVMNDSREVLAVQEKSGYFRGTGVWKIPTGVVEEGEDIPSAAMREVKEETGIETEFLEVLAFRQTHKAYFGKSDLFFICTLRPLSFDIKKQDEEIEAAQWMPIEGYAAQPIVQELEVFKYTIELCLAKADKNYAGFSPVPLKSNSGDQISYLFANTRDLKNTGAAMPDG